MLRLTGVSWRLQQSAAPEGTDDSCAPLRASFEEHWSAHCPNLGPLGGMEATAQCFPGFRVFTLEKRGIRGGREEKAEGGEGGALVPFLRSACCVSCLVTWGVASWHVYVLRTVLRLALFALRLVLRLMPYPAPRCDLWVMPFVASRCASVLVPPELCLHCVVFRVMFDAICAIFDVCGCCATSRFTLGGISRSAFCVLRTVSLAFC